MEAANFTIKKKLSTQAYGDGTGNGSLDLDGLKNAIDDGTNYSTYGGIDRSVKTWWKANYDGTGGSFSIDLCQTMFGNCTDGDEKPDLILCNQTIWNKFHARIQPQQRFSEASADLAKIGFQTFEFNGASVVADNFCPSGYMFFLNTKYVQFIVNQNANFIWTPPKSGTAEWAYVRQLIVMANLIITAPWRCGQIRNVS